MSLNTSPSVVTNGMVFCYDAGNEKSFKGKPTTNYAFNQNPRVDSTYAPYSATASGTWNAKHSDALVVYNDAGDNITGYANTGVGDWTNTYHAIWTYDTQLARPVVTMRDIDGVWKAKSFGLGQTYNSMGLSAGSTYTISWLSWTDDISKCANAGLYSPNSGGSYNFWDGQSNSFGTAYNTKARTWQRVYATFTVSSGLNYAAGLSCYMYGMYGNRGTVKIADVQIEAGSYSGFTKTATRSNTQTILDLTNNSIITANNLNYASNGTFSFNGSSSKLEIPISGNPTLFSMEVAIKNYKAISPNTNMGPYYSAIGFTANGYSTIGLNLGDWTGSLANETLSFWHYGNSQGAVSIQDTIDANWNIYTINWNGSAYDIWVNGIKRTTYSSFGTVSLITNLTKISVGYNEGWNYWFNGDIGSLKVYNKQLTEAEVQQNFNALRGRYGL
jgi:hypothetical protein